MREQLNENRFWSKVNRTDGCWFWLAGSYNGYGLYFFNHRSQLAHRVAYEMEVGPIPKQNQIDHLCHNWDVTCPGGKTCPHRRCVNPAHLEATTIKINVLRGRGLSAANAKKTHCVRGHAFDKANTRYRNGSSSYRVCRECCRQHKRRYKQIQREQLGSTSSY